MSAEVISGVYFVQAIAGRLMDARGHRRRTGRGRSIVKPTAAGLVGRVGAHPRPGVGRHADREATRHLNADEWLVLEVLDDELVTAQEIAGFAQLSIYRCRRALGALRARGLAIAERRGNCHVWKRA